jgi:hypothetical protein
MAITVTDHRDLLDRILQDHGLRAADLELVPNVQAWCRQRGVEEKNPNRQAKCLLNSDGTCHIVMLEVLTDDAIAGGKGGMLMHGFMSEVESLDTDVKYLAHLMLHEVACHVLRTTEQGPRDVWAFERVTRYAI